ncbi:EAL domain-containing protein [Pseudoalteromonas sp. SWXJZ94C]|uniref:bifunctional diguanylate cyclase/phosphodiesterase n=1 Tax=Pseudoalteromonas sp. SWXJZ94C TaxID=2792065 RepID=UPI0018CF5213|nr:GGDEF domain-containing phosphodiesterase [Pseudoalteromonas sp. SWXJZ94C]MBH0057897.1 EAL domain-containing protein [Pseudoalteromonas sp. SWXJZ94C]
MHYLSNFFLLNDQLVPYGQIANWRISALRITLTLVMLLCFGIACHTYSSAIELNLIYVVALTISFFVSVLILLIASKRFYVFSAHALLVAIVAASVAMNLFLTDLELAKVGSMFMYSCPIISLMLLGYKTALSYAVLNIIPFYMITKNIDLSDVTGIAQQLPDANLYITGLIFLFFNICIPLAVARTIVAAKRLNKTIMTANTHLKDKNELYRTLFTESNKAKIIVDENFVISDLNQQAIEMFAIKNNIKDKNIKLSSLLPSLDYNKPNTQNQIVKYKGNYLQANYQYVMSANYRVYDFYDCTQEQLIKQNLSMMEQENKRLRFRDSQTKLPNREYFEIQCDKLSAKYQKDFYIVVTQSANNEYLDLKLTKADSQTLLINAYKRLKTMTEGPLLCAYIGAGKLAFIISADLQSELQNKLLTQIKSTLDKTYNVLGIKCQQSFLFGFAKYLDDGKNSAIVLSNACEALKLANCNIPLSGYNEKQSQAFIEKHEISMLLDEALQQNALSVYYQPKVNSGGECIGLEALARWNSPILGNVSPVVFIPIAEEYRMVSRLTDLIIQKVCAQIADWNKAGIPNVPVAINISLIDFSQTDFMSKLVKHLADFDVKPHQIELELTETSLEANQAHSLNLMQTLQSWGFTISVDDFGVGYSNIARLADYPINKLKLDRSLISQVTNSARQQSLVKAIHVMCEELDIKCVAEGVETQDQVEIMTQMGCKEFQGFYFAKPMAADAYRDHVKRYGLRFLIDEAIES